MIFEWDDEKAAKNYHKHGIKFENAVRVFEDINCVTKQDRYENNEYRWQTIGTVGGEQVLLVAHTYPNAEGQEVCRIISARKATKQERKRYGDSKI